MADPTLPPLRARARWLYAVAWLVGRLPLRVLHGIAGLAARLAGTRGRDYQVALTNLRLIAAASGSDPGAFASDANVRAVLRGNVMTALESLRFWTRPASANLALVHAVHGLEHLQAALAQGRGLLIAAPHYGNWELLNQWLAQRMELAVLYAPPESADMDAFLNHVRQRPGVQTIRAEAAGVRRQLRHLQGGGALGILPDQQPKRGGDGVFAPFFGRPALTMTLFSRLARRSGAPALLVAAERNADARGFSIHIAPLPAAVADDDAQQACTALNAAIEVLARRDFRQYQWAYKRFSLSPDGSDNPYWPHAYPRATRSREGGVE
ncbi:MAG: lipid A biosynthesis lauroyl acyltransferase [Pseudoxanthomonas suwonensis]|nr:lipid A biosynthesis lauroyl acyltransferase [Pseudoxanthomonas suwonensis]